LKRALIPFIFLLSFSTVAEGQVLSAFVREQVGSLPQGRFMISYVSLSSSIDSMYGRDGESKTLSSNFNQNVTFQKITQEEPVRGNQLAGLFLSNGVSLADSAGSLSGAITGNVTGKIPVIGYGITDDLGLYVSVPVLNFKVQARYRFDPSGTTAGLLSQLQASDQASVAAEVNAALNTSLESKLYQAGLKWDPNLNRDYIGDAQVILMKVLKTEATDPVKQSIQPMMVLPTASDHDIHDLYGLKAGDRRWGLGVKYALQRPLPANLQLNFGLSGTYLFANTQARRLPKDQSDELNEDLDPSVSVSGGTKLQSQVQLRYPFPRWVGLNVGMVYQKRWAESLNGNLFQPEQYALASARSSYDLLSSYASIDINSIQSFLEGNFVFPALAELGVGLPLRGQNAIAEPVFELQGTMFF